MIRELYTPETIVQTEMRRKMLAWYIRFDLFAGLMAGNETVLGIEWFQAYERCYASLSMNDPTNQNLRIETCFAEHRTAAVEMALLFAKLPKGEISVTDFMRENALLGERIRRLRLNIEPFAQHSHHTIKYFEGCPKLDPDDIVNPYELGKLFGPPLFSVNFLLLDWFALDTMFKYQSALMLQQSPPAEMEALALEQCQIFEAIEFWSGSPAGSILPAQASLGLTCLFLPRDEKHTMWCRRKLAKVESLGWVSV